MAEKIKGFILFDAGPGDGHARNAEIAAVKAAIEAEEIAAGRVYDPTRFRACMPDDSLIVANYVYTPRG
jgi:hypothetical protein